MNYLPLLKAPQGAKKWLAFGCSHAPLHDPKALAVVQERIREWAPDQVIHLGDLHEADSASRWPSEYDWNIEDEFHAANFEVLQPVRLANPNQDADYIFLPGNHDANLLAIDRIPSKVRNRCDYELPQYTKGSNKGAPVWLNEELLTHWRRPCKYRYNRREGTHRIGATVFAHGYECGASSDEAQSITLGWPFGLFVSAHTHRPLEGTPVRAMKTKTLPLDRWFTNAGCTRKMACEYMERKRQQLWGTALVYGWSLDINSPRFSKTWDAFTEVIEMFD